jgi:peptide/nickel transport system substrate-binding protein
MKTLLIALSVFLLSSLLVIGCSSSTSTAPTTKSASPPTAITATTPAASTASSTISAPVSKQGISAPQAGGILKIITARSPVSLGAPWKPGSPGDPPVRDPVAETLLHIDNNGLPAPWLFTSWQLSPDTKSIVFKLKQGVKFHDGTDFNADAVKYNLDLCKTAGTVTGLTSVASIDAVDPYTIRFNLLQYDASILNGLSLAYIISPAAAQKNGQDWCQYNPVGTGPFKFVNYQNDVSLKYEKFSGYWQSGKPYLDAIEFSFIADPVTALAAYKGGQGQYLWSPTPLNGLDLKKSGKIIDQGLSNVYGLAGDSANTGSPFANIKVRQAVSHAIDNAAIATNLGQGFWQPTNQLFGPGTMAFNPNIQGYAYNPQKAKDLLAEAGYPNGFQTSFIVSSTSSNKDWQSAVQAYLKAVGINADIQVVQPAAFTTFSNKGWKNSLIVCSPANSIDMDPGQSMRSSLSTKGSQNASILFPADYEAKLNQAQIEIDNQKRATILQGLAKMMVDDYCMVNFSYLNFSINARDPQVHDTELLSPHIQQWTPEDTWLSK